MREVGATPALFAALNSSKNRKMRIELLRALANICYSSSGTGYVLKEEVIVHIVKFLTSKSHKLRCAAASTLRNISQHPENQDLIAQHDGQTREWFPGPGTTRGSG